MRNIQGFDDFEKHLQEEKEKTERSTNKFCLIALVVLGVVAGGVAYGVRPQPKVSVQETVVVTPESTLPSKPPVTGAEWSDREQSWMCPVGEFNVVTMDYSGWVNCTATDYPKEPTAEEKQRDLEVSYCIGRSGKKERVNGERTSGWHWARGLCQENPNAF
jgi:hypothetical protein